MGVPPPPPTVLYQSKSQLNQLIPAYIALYKIAIEKLGYSTCSVSVSFFSFSFSFFLLAPGQGYGFATRQLRIAGRSSCSTARQNTKQMLSCSDNGYVTIGGGK